MSVPLQPCTYQHFSFHCFFLKRTVTTVSTISPFTSSLILITKSRRKRYSAYTTLHRALSTPPGSIWFAKSACDRNMGRVHWPRPPVLRRWATTSVVRCQNFATERTAAFIGSDRFFKSNSRIVQTGQIKILVVSNISEAGRAAVGRPGSGTCDVTGTAARSLSRT